MPLDDQNELFYLVDTSDNVLGSIPRGQAHADKTKIHRAVYVLITNQKHQILLQKRSQKKDSNPGFWTISISGHVTYGQTWEQATAREIKEEAGLDIDRFKLLASYLHSNSQETEYCRVYQADYNNQPLTPDPDEVDELRWVNLQDLPQFIATHKFTEWAKRSLQESAYLSK